jgi:geranylgeranyl reductase family protein
MADCDVVIIGGGPAGGMAAWTLAPHAKVVLLERRRVPREKLCSGVLSPKSVEQLRGVIDLQPVLLGRSNETWIGREGVGTLLRHDELLFASRPRLDAALLEAAAERGADVRDGCRVEAVDPAEGTVRLDTGEVVRAQVLIGADGATGVTARFAEGVRRGVAMEARIPDHRAGKRPTLLDFAVPRGYAWAFPKADGTVAVGIGTGQAKAPLIRSWLDRFAQRQGFRLPDRIPGHPVTYRLARRLVIHRLLLTGDAAGAMDPLIAEGIPYALWTGRRAALAALDHLGRCAPLDRYEAARSALVQFQRVQRSIEPLGDVLQGPITELILRSGIARRRLWHHLIERRLPA